MPNSIYKSTNLTIDDLLKDIRNGKIGLPDLQRPFVWANDKVRKLLDSMLKGFPIGYILLWESPVDYADKKTAIGNNDKKYEAPKELVIDGQQRLTALLTSIYGIPIKDKSFNDRVIVIAFDPLAKEFKNADASTKNDPRFIPDISEAFKAKEENRLGSFRKSYIARFNEGQEKKRLESLTSEQEDLVERGLSDLLDLMNYLLPTMEILPSADEEAVSEIFVRVNSQGQTLKQDDFIMTLLSVYEPDMRSKIERFCADSHGSTQGTSYNHLIRLTPAHLIRVTVGLGFSRGRLRYAYEILRGKDLGTKQTSVETRMENFMQFGKALDQVLNLNNWHAYLNTLGEAGYIASSQIGSDNGLMFCYTFYLMGKLKFKVESVRLKRIIARWYFASAVSSYYVGSFESDFEKQLNDLKLLVKADEFEDYFNRATSALMTDDFFRVTLPNDLNANEATGPSWNAFVAAQVILGANLLFNTKPLSSALLPGSSGDKKSIDKHHIFPDHYLEERGYKAVRSNRANFAYIDYENNIDISDNPPVEYVPTYRQKLGEAEYLKNCEMHALPVGFENMNYGDFLAERRVLMSQLIRRGFERL